MKINGSNGIKRILFTPLIVFCKWLGRNHPVTLARLRYFARFHKRLHLDNPRNLNEKILYLSLKTDTSRWSDLTDKYKVREYVGQVGLGEHLVPLYGVWERAEDIDFDMLPDRFVMKVNHGSGDCIIVRDKSKLNRRDTISYFSRLLDSRYGELEAGKHYYGIKPKVIAEELLVNDIESARHSTSVIDYKIWCINGNPESVFVISNRRGDTFDFMVYDLEWEAHPEFAVFSDTERKAGLMPRPVNFDKMLDIARKLSANFPEVRVDLYNLGGRIYVGELTFTSLGGMMNYFTQDYLLELGGKCRLPHR